MPLDNYLPIFLMIALAALFALLSIVGSKLLAPRRPTGAKQAPYECGIVPDREPAQRFPVRFYLVAMIFIIFDIEIIFLYPWAVIFQQLQVFGLVEMIVFSLVVFVAFVYLVRNGALEWGPAKRFGPARGVGLGRTSQSTVRRIGTSSDEAA